MYAAKRGTRRGGSVLPQDGHSDEASFTGPALYSTDATCSALDRRTPTPSGELAALNCKDSWWPVVTLLPAPSSGRTREARSGDRQHSWPHARVMIASVGRRLPSLLSFGTVHAPVSLTMWTVYAAVGRWRRSRCRLLPLTNSSREALSHHVGTRGPMFGAWPLANPTIEHSMSRTR